MNAFIETRTFQSGNSVALRLPKALGIPANETMAVHYHDDVLTARRIPTPSEEAERLQRFRAMLAELKELGPGGEIEVREPFEFPDRPGL